MISYWYKATCRFRANIAHRFLLQILAEIKVLCRKQDAAYGLLKLLVTDLTILIFVEIGEDFCELIVTHDEAPMITEVFELPLLNLTRLS